MRPRTEDTCTAWLTAPPDAIRFTREAVHPKRTAGGDQTAMIAGPLHGMMEQFHIENVDCPGSRESDYPQPKTRKKHAFSVV